MLRSLGNVLAYPLQKLALRRLAHGEPDRFRVTVIGGAGGIGQPLSLLLRLHPLVSTLKLYDLKLAKGVAVDLSHIDRPGLTKGFEGKEELLKALRCTDIVVVAAGMPRKPGQSREDLFDANACVTAEIADAMGLVSPDAFMAIITNPINSMVPVAAEVLKKRGVYNPALLAGITTLDVVRARKFVADCIFVDPRKIRVSVIGGHSGKTIVPLISHIEPPFTGDDADITRITKRIQEAGTEVVEAKGGSGSATLSMAYSAANFVNSLLIAKSDRKEVRDTAFVESCLTPAKFFASEVRIGAGGIIDAVPLPELSQYEDQLMCEALPILLDDIKKGQEFGEAYEIAEKKEGECEDNMVVKTPPPPPKKVECSKKEEPKKDCKKKEEPKKECKKKEEPKDCKKEEPKKDCKKATSPRPKSCDGGSGEKKESICAELLKQMKNAPCRKGADKPKEEQPCGKKGGNECEEKDSQCKNSFDPCKDFNEKQ